MALIGFLLALACAIAWYLASRHCSLDVGSRRVWAWVAAILAVPGLAAWTAALGPVAGFFAWLTSLMAACAALPYLAMLRRPVPR